MRNTGLRDSRTTAPGAGVWHVQRGVCLKCGATQVLSKRPRKAFKLEDNHG